MPKRPPPPTNQRPESRLTPAVLTALLALLGTVLAACVSSPALVALINTARGPASLQAAPALASPPAAANQAPTVTIDGPTTAELNTTTFFTVLSSNAVRGVWSINGFTDEPVTVEPLGASHELFVEPTNATRDGDSFTLVFTVYDAAGNSASAQHRFEVVSP